MPVFDLLIALEAFNFANKVALNVRNGILADNAVLSILVQVLPVEVRMEGLGQEVKIDIIIFEQVKHIKGPDGRHFFLRMYKIVLSIIKFQVNFEPN